MTTAPASSAPQLARPALLGRLRLAAADIKLAHSIFALPFAILAAFLARPADPTKPGGTWPTFAAQLSLVVLSMVLARSWAMLVNRLADRDIDPLNPRTARRMIASGKLSVADARTIALICAALFIAVSSLFWVFFANPWPTILSIPVLAWIAFYSFTKRFTAACHIFLGGALAASPLAAAIAINPAYLAHAATVFFLAGMVVCWVAGFDVIYALQDTDFDKQAGLHSIPSRLGPAAAIWISRLLHAAAFALLILAARSEPRFGPVFFTAVALVGCLLITEHTVLARRGKAGLQMAFFTINGIVSCVLGLAGVVDLLCI
jgi:4-hydroxybenzoate polyprenyltransferase